MINVFNSNWTLLLKNRIESEIGSEYSSNPAKFSILLNAFSEEEIITKFTNKEQQKAIESNPKAMDGLKEIVKNFNENNSW